MATTPSITTQPDQPQSFISSCNLQLAPIPGVASTVRAVIDAKLSNLSGLDQILDFLSPQEREEERDYRQQFANNFGLMVMLRFDQGRILARYQRWCNQQSTAESKRKLFETVCLQLGYKDVNTPYRVVRDFKAANTVKPFLREHALLKGMDLAEAKYRDLIEVIKEESEDTYEPVDPEVRTSKAERLLSHALEKWTQGKQKAPEPTKSRQDQLANFLQRLYDGEDVATVRREVPEVLKKLTHYKRGDAEVVGKERERKQK